MKIKDIGHVVTGKTPLTEVKEYYGGDIMFISPSDLHGDYLIEKSEKTITEEGLNSIGTNSIDGISVLAGCIGWNMGNVAMCNSRCATNQQINAITQFNTQMVDPRYIYYWLKGKKDYLFSIASVTRTPILSKSIFEDIDIPIPCLGVQKKVANLLSNIDEKIRINNKINDYLEEMAKTIYDYWFVQFDFPDENGNPYKSSGGKMSFIDDFGLAPSDWKSGNLYDIAEFINGLACQKYRPDETEDSLPVIKIKEMHEGISSNTDRVKATIPPNNIVNTGDILFSWSASLEVQRWAGFKSALNQHIFKVIPKENYTQSYVYHQLKAYIIKFVQLAEARKTTMGHITSDHLRRSVIVLPPENIICKFSKQIDSIHTEISRINKENQELYQLRNWLLPMLMNGQAAIED